MKSRRRIDSNLKKYSEADKILTDQASGEKRIVFMGNLITEFWAKIDTDS